LSTYTLTLCITLSTYKLTKEGKKHTQLAFRGVSTYCVSGAVIKPRSSYSL